MLLTIINCGPRQGGARMIEVRLQGGGHSDWCRMNYHSSLAGGLIAQMLQCGGDAQRIGEVLIAAGDVDHTVRIESAEIEFFQEPWETTALAACSATRARATTSYLRSVVLDTPPRELPDLNYELGGASPMRILHIVARPRMPEVYCESSCSLESAVQAFCHETAVDYEICSPIGWAPLRERLSDRRRPVHILLYDGPVSVGQESVSVWLGQSAAEDEWLSVTEFCAALRANGIAVLCIDARGLAATGLARIARAACAAGVGNLIGSDPAGDCWMTASCWRALYASLVRGSTLEQAILSARHLVHYGGQSVVMFEAAQQSVDLSHSEQLRSARQKLHGFSRQFLPPWVDCVGDGQAPALLATIQQTAQPIALVAAAGMGKTQLAHRVALYLAQRASIDYAFYFNFAVEHYSLPIMLEMIAPVFDLAADQPAQVSARLQASRCCFVLDGYLDDRADREPAEVAARRGLEAQLSEFCSDGHIVLATGVAAGSELSVGHTRIRLLPLPELEQERFAPGGMLAPVVLRSLSGNPFLLAKLPRLLAELPQETAQEIGRHIASAGTVTRAFYEWRWGLMDNWARQLLILCASVRGLVMEMVMVVLDQTQMPEAARELYACLGGGPARFAAELENWKLSGFVTGVHYGHGIDPECRSFLDRMLAVGALPPNVEQRARLAFNRIIVNAIQRLAHHVLQKQDAPFADYLLGNRRHWVEPFECLWRSGDHLNFLAGKSAFDRLLLQRGLREEAAAWSLTLIKLQPESPVASTEMDAHGRMAWLLLACSALGHAGAETDPTLSNGCWQWAAWMQELPRPLDDRSQLGVFRQAVQCLDSFYRARGLWQSGVELMEQARDTYLHFGVWPEVIQALESLAQYHLELGRPDLTLHFEEQLLNDPPYADAPPGFHSQQLLRVVLARIARNEAGHARAALDVLRESPDAARLARTLDNLQEQIERVTAS